MKAAAFDYVRAADAAEAQALLARHGDGARLLAGGQSLLATLNLRLSEPAILIDISRIGLDTITRRGDVLHIGAMATHAAIGRSALVAECAPMLAEAAPLIAHAAIRNRGTLGGSLALADPAAEWPACVLALGATIILSSAARGERRVLAEDFFQGLYQTAAEPDEMILGVDFPVLGSERQGCMELARRHGDYALVGVAMTLRLEAGLVRGLRAAFFGVGPTPMLVRLGEGLPPAEAARASLAGDLAPQDDPGMDGQTRLHLAQVLFKRAVMRLTA